MPPNLARDIGTPAVTRTRINQVDTQIAYFEASIRKLKMARGFLKNHLDTYIYPVLTLPNEIISEIFFHTLPEEAYQSPPKHSDSPSPCANSPLALGHICSKWRQIALSTPTLWTALELYLDNVVNSNQLRLLEIWLNRSGGCPLSIGIWSGATSTPDVCRFIDALVPHCGRWQDMDLDIPFRDLIRITGDMPLLHTLSVGLTDMEMDDGAALQPHASEPMQIFHTAAALTTLILIPPFPVGPEILIFPWAQITFLYIIATSPHELIYILRALVNIGQFRVGITASSPDEIMANIRDLPPLVHMHTLSLDGESDPVGIMQLLDCLTLPALTSLHAVERCLMSLGAPAVQRLLVRSGCTQWAICITIRKATVFNHAY
ncbi:hypothetical protein DFH07DRAFT_884339 [Mycena maculata]|uniref:F-box domain-containing protein n=1 Tax=Mycena maculata TaxID=230809 RepID=A0AAD7J9Z2_9AGAR|nr:hypothetical protein DFH07DRAFT_884339 [Mycena maculata]